MSVKADGDGGDKRLTLARICSLRRLRVCVFVMHGLSFVSVSKVTAVVWGGIGAGALYLWNVLGSG